MTSALARMICRFMAIAMMMLPFHSGQASMVSTDQVISAASAQADRSVVISYLNRSQTVNEMQSLGLDPLAAKERVAAMTDSEVGDLAGKINAAPAGGNGLVLLVLVVFFIWFFAFRR